ncbi:MAG: metallophosphoesterase family protein [Bacteroidales bacterium]
MTRIGLLSDTHGHLHPELARIFKDCDEIWHAGDFGNLQTALSLQAIKPLRGVFGNIDDQAVRSDFPEFQRFHCEQVDVLMTHIGGYPGNYDRRVRDIIRMNPPALFITGHSHILKVMYDEKNRLLHINPGAAGRRGIHKVITMVRFVIDGSNIRDLEVIEFDR